MRPPDHAARTRLSAALRRRGGASAPDLGRLSPAKCQVRTVKALRTKDLGPFRAVRASELGLYQENGRPPTSGKAGHGAAEVQKP